MYIYIHIIDIIVIPIRYTLCSMHWMTTFVPIFSVQSEQRLKKITVSRLTTRQCDTVSILGFLQILETRGRSGDQNTVDSIGWFKCQDFVWAMRKHMKSRRLFRNHDNNVLVLVLFLSLFSSLFLSLSRLFLWLFLLFLLLLLPSLLLLHPPTSLCPCSLTFHQSAVGNG